VTPNDSHFDICSAALDAGFDVICDKPLTTSSKTSVQLLSKVSNLDRVLAVTYCYSGYPLVRQARAMVRDGIIGNVRQVHVQYVQGWAADTDLTSWRLDPSKVGGSSILIDLGIHAFHLAAFVTGLSAQEVFADLGHTIPGRLTDDYGGVLLKYENGAHGTMWVTSAAAGSEHGLLFRVFGDEGGLEWHQETPNAMMYMPKGDFARSITRRKSPLMTAAALQQTRTEIGHPEGYLEAFANIYSEVAWQIAARQGIDTAIFGKPDFPDAHDGIAGLAFVEAAVASAATGSWRSIEAIT
jgi:predicted dehydrogenase